MAGEPLTPERAVRLLRAKTAELEARVLEDTSGPGAGIRETDELRADIALIAALLADHIESTRLVQIDPLCSTDPPEALQYFVNWLEIRGYLSDKGLNTANLVARYWANP